MSGPGSDERLPDYADEAEIRKKKRNIGAARRGGRFQIVACHPIVVGVSRCSAKLSSNIPERSARLGLAVAIADVERNERRESECLQKIWQRAGHQMIIEEGKRSGAGKAKTAHGEKYYDGYFLARIFVRVFVAEIYIDSDLGGDSVISAAQTLKRARCKSLCWDRRNFHLFQPLLYQVAPVRFRRVK